MQQEIEAKFLRQNHDQIRNRLKILGGICKMPMTLIRRTVFDYPDRRLQKAGAWVRLREELDGNVELMLKKVTAAELGKTFEQPVIVDNYEEAKVFLLAIGLEIKAEEESKRELWHLGDAEIMLDRWPWVDPYIEIEAPTDEAVKRLADKLDLSWSDAKFGSVTAVYEDKYGISDSEFAALELTIKFDSQVPKELYGK